MKKSILAAGLAAVLSHQSVLADDEMIVVASRVDTLSSLPASVTTITAEDIKVNPSRTLPELLSEQVGVNTSSLYSHGSRASIDVRGFGETATQNTLILLDGRRLTGIDLSAVNFASIPLENIERIEIIRGTGGVLYGDGATGGVINIMTKDPRDTKNYSTLSATTGSDNYREMTATTSYSNQQFAVTAHINSQESDGYRDHNAFDQNSGQIDVRVPLSTGEIYAKIGAFQQNIDLPGVRRVNPSTLTNQLKSDRKGTETPNDWADEYTEYTTLGYSLDLNDRDTLIVDGGYRRKRQRSQFDYGFGYGDYAATEVKTLSFTPRLMLARNVAGYTADWLLGIDLYRYEYDSSRSNFGNNVAQPIHQLDVTQESTALYGQTTIALTENTSLTAGARIQSVRQKARDTLDPTAPGASVYDSQATDFTESDTEESYELGLKHAFMNGWSVYARVDRSVRFGTVDELFEYNDAFAQVFSPLKPQVSRGSEVGINYMNTWLRSTMSIFKQTLTDEIHLNPATFQNVNLDDTEREGVELSVTARMNETVTIKAGYTYLNAEFVEGLNSGNLIPLVPEHTYAVSLLGVLPLGVTTSLNWNYVSAAHFANDPTGTFGSKIPSYQTVDAKISKVKGPLELSLQVNNIFEEAYYNFGINSTAAVRYNAYPLAERTAYVSASYTFE